MKRIGTRLLLIIVVSFALGQAPLMAQEDQASEILGPKSDSNVVRKLFWLNVDLLKAVQPAMSIAPEAVLGQLKRVWETQTSLFLDIVKVSQKQDLTDIMNADLEHLDDLHNPMRMNVEGMKQSAETDVSAMESNKPGTAAKNTAELSAARASTSETSEVVTGHTPQKLTKSTNKISPAPLRDKELKPLSKEWFEWVPDLEMKQIDLMQSVLDRSTDEGVILIAKQYIEQIRSSREEWQQMDKTERKP